VCQLAAGHRPLVRADAAVRQCDVHRLLFHVGCSCGLVQRSALPFVCGSWHTAILLYTRAEAATPRRKRARRCLSITETG
jgi:hypothetical protein